MGLLHGVELGSAFLLLLIEFRAQLFTRAALLFEALSQMVAFAVELFRCLLRLSLLGLQQVLRRLALSGFDAKLRP